VLDKEGNTVHHLAAETNKDIVSVSTRCTSALKILLPKDSSRFRIILFVPLSFLVVIFKSSGVFEST
jgi:hypothetical protein